MVLKKKISGILGCNTLSSRDVVRIILPFIIERIIGVLIGMFETAFLSTSNPLIVEATGLTATIQNLFMQFPFAICVGGAVLAAQYRGKDDYKGIRESMGQTFSFAVPISLLLFLIILLFGKPVLSLLYPTVDDELISASFILLAGNTASLIIYSAAQPMVSTLSGMGDGKSWSIVNLTAAVVSILGTYFLVGVCNMGIYGPVVSLVIHRLYKFAIAYYLVKKNHPELQIKMKSFIYWEGEKAKKIVKVALPVCFEFIFINIASIIQTSVIAGLGRMAIRANAIFQSVASFVEIFLLSLTEATTSIVGRCVGAGNKKDARKMSFVIMFSAVLLGLLFSAIYLPFSDFVLKTYNPTEDILRIAPVYVLTYTLARIILFAMSEISCSALRSSGDTGFCSVVSLVGNYLVLVPLAFVFANVLEWNLMGVWIANFAYWAIRALVFSARILSKKWCYKKLV